MNPNQIVQGYAGTGLPTATYAAGQTATPQLSLNEKLQTLAGHARNMSQMAFQIGTRLGALQPVPSGTASAKPTEAHVNATINELDAALSQLSDDLNRISSFVG